MANNSTTVSNGYLSNNPDFAVADDLISNKRYQQVKLTDPTVGSTDPIGNAENPMHVQGEVDVDTSLLATQATLAALLAMYQTTTVGTFRDTVAAAGTREQLPANACKWVDITAETDNTSYVVIGGSSVVAALATRQGRPLIAGETVRYWVTNTNVLWADVLVNGEGFTATFGN